MIAEWMMYCVLASLGLALAATLAERVLLAGRGPVRLVWIGAVALSIVIPVLAFRDSSESKPIASQVSQANPAVVGDSFDPTAIAEATTSTTAPSTAVPSVPVRNWRTTLNKYDTPLLIVWGTLSFALACSFFGSVIVLALMRRNWTSQTVHGIPVMLSERTGPAVVGTIWPDIVLPRWVLELPQSQQQLMLRHEDEHRRACDAQLLTIARLALIIMPWNAALWWQILRLRVAVELDCDARVLQSADARSYGDLLLEVAGSRGGTSLIGATAFAERATQLEKRIRVLSRHRVHTSRAARAVASGVGIIVLSVAWAAPHPAVPLLAVVQPSPLAANKVVDDLLVRPKADADSLILTKKTPVTVKRNDSTKKISLPAADSAQNVARQMTADSSRRSMTRTVVPGQTTRQTSSTVQSVFDAVRDSLQRIQQEIFTDSAVAYLYDGIPLSQAEKLAARNLITRLQVQQQAQNSAFMAQRTASVAHRDSALRALLTNDSDRAALSARLLPGARGAAPITLPLDTSGIQGRGGRGGGAGLPTGGRGGSPGGGPRGGGPMTPERQIAAVDATFHRLFDGMTLTTEQENAARAALAQSQKDISTPPPALIRVSLQTKTVIVATPADSALTAIVSSTSDKSKVRSRLATIPPQ